MPIEVAQTFETTLYPLGGGDAVTFMTVPRRSFKDALNELNAQWLVPELGLRDSFGDSAATALAPVEVWSLPFLIDAILGRYPNYYEALEPFIAEPFLMHRRREERRRSPSEFAQYLTFNPVVPFEASPQRSRSLAEVITTGSATTGAIGAVEMGHSPLLLLVVPAGIVVMGAARGIAQALEIGLRSRLLSLMGVDDPHRPDESGDDPEE